MARCQVVGMMIWFAFWCPLSLEGGGAPVTRSAAAHYNLEARLMDARPAWIGILFIIASLLSFLYFVYERERKLVADARDLDQLDLLVWEHEERIADNRKTIEQLLRKIEKNQAPSVTLTEQLGRAR